MLLILEIILTVVSWRKGWRGWALVPVVSGLLIGLMSGFIAGAVGCSEVQFRQFKVALLPVDLICIGVLVWMTTKGKKVAHPVTPKVELDEAQAATSKA